MKKIVSVMFAFLLLAAISNAAITVTKGGKQVKMQKNAVIATDGEEETVINYNGFKVKVPAGVKLVVRQDDEGNLVFNGNNLAGVKLSNLTVNSNGAAALTVNPNTNTINVQEGVIQITSATGNTSEMRAGQTAMMVSVPEIAQAIRAREFAEQEALEAKARAEAEAAKAGDKAKAKAEAKAAKEAAKAEAKAAKEAAKAEAAAKGELSEPEAPSFVVPTTESAASEQAVENVIETEEDLSPSAPTL